MSDRKPANPHEWAIGTSTCLFDHDFNECLQECSNAGISHIELGLGGGLDNPEQVALMAERANAIKATGLTLWSVHIPFGTRWDVSTLDATLRSNIIEVLSDTLRKVAGWGATKAVIHPSWEPILTEERAERLKWSKDVMQHLAEIGVSSGITLAAEDLPRTCIGNNSAEMLELLAGSSALQVCFDVNHLLSETPEQFVRNVGSHIVTVHMSDYDNVNERHWMPGRGIINWQAVIKELALAGYTGPFMFELAQKNAEAHIEAKDLVECFRGLVASTSIVR